MLAAFVAALVPAQISAQPTFVGASWSSQSVYLLNSDFSIFSSFAVTDATPNGVTSNGSLIFAGYFSTTSIVAYNFAGVEQFRFSDDLFSGLQGLTVVGNELAVASFGTTYFIDAITGTLNRSFANGGTSVEGMSYDGSLLWELGDDLIGRDPLTGAVITSFNNPLQFSCGFGGTGLATPGNGKLVLGCGDGSWYEVSDATGAVLNSSDLGFDIYGLDDISNATVLPEPSTYALMTAGLAMIAFVARRRRTA